MTTYQACVIGAGPGGYVAAIRAAQLGLKTAIVERDQLGGVCLNWGCIPSKAYIGASKLWEKLKTAEEMGISAKELALDLDKMRVWKNGVVKRLTDGIGGLLKMNGVAVIRGRAKFVADGEIEVAKADGTVERVRSEKFLVATGSRPFDLPGFPIDGVNLITSTEALDLAAVPKSLLVLGGGVIGLEIGTYLAKFGAQVTVVELMDQVLPGTDPDLVDVVMRGLKKKGVKVMTGTKAVGAQIVEGGVAVKVQTPKGEETLHVEKVLVSIGRKPNSQDLGLEAVGVKTDAKGFVVVDGRMRTSNPSVFAIGDVAGGALLAHKASKEGLVAAAAMAGAKDVYDVTAMPAATFTDPEIGTVGLTEAEAKKRGYEVKTAKFPFGALGRAIAGRETDGLVKMVVDAKDDRILGVGVVGANASDLIAEATLAIEAGLTAADVALTVHAHPTLAESLMEVAEAVHGKAVHIFQPKK
ncbi:MAG TPA: dihydrolipoyl dehydrogenase [Planctomycetota bacterium]|nr:dihydrolipoyl dehydrogenase [Planctomycetota bacterium]